MLSANNAIALVPFVNLPWRTCVKSHKDSLKPIIPLQSHEAREKLCHYNDVIMSVMASQITSLTTVYSTVYSTHRSVSRAFVSPRSPVNSPHKSPVTRKMFPFDDVIMAYFMGCILSSVNTTLSQASMHETDRRINGLLQNISTTARYFVLSVGWYQKCKRKYHLTGDWVWWVYLNKLKAHVNCNFHL